MSPNEGGSKAYGLLRNALKETKKIGVAKMMIRSKEQLAVIRVYANTLVVETIHYPDEVRDVKEVPNVPAKVESIKKELDTAKLLIEQLTTSFDPEKYKDDYRTALIELIEEKKNKKQTTTVKTGDKPIPGYETNLMDALQASLERAKRENPKPSKGKTASKK